MLFELRQYTTRPGQRDNWVRFAEDEIIPFQTSKGMHIVASWVGEGDSDAFIWIRRFESEAERERLYKEVYESDHWKTNVAPRIPDLIDREQIKVTRMTPTPRSAIQ
ncbi:MAG TPA: NIPSNAP family protein [Chloroflexota bacterium]|nr:NIPSNAP family protein [Chloroflexota bacterium]